MVVWRYDLLVAGLGAMDDVSLATSLAGLADEGVTGELEGCSTRRAMAVSNVCGSSSFREHVAGPEDRYAVIGSTGDCPST